jgi:hypothetical protein
LYDIDWNLEKVDLIEQIDDLFSSVVTGSVYVPIIRQQQLVEYNEKWPDLLFSYGTRIDQFKVTFKNEDGTILDVQYVDKGSKAVDPVTRVDNPIPIPTKESTISSNFTYAGWDGTLVSVFSNQTYTATYTESVRKYTIKYISKNTVLQENVADFGDVVPYTGDIPLYTEEEEGYKFYLFKGWSSSGLVNGDKVVEALFDSFEYTDGYFNNKDFSELTPVEIYGMTQMKLHETYADIGDRVQITLGNDIDYPDIEAKVLIETPVEFTGTNYIDTNITLFDEDRDFVLAVDYMISSDSADNATLVHCHSDNATQGLKTIHKNGSTYLQWQSGQNSDEAITALVNKREMLVIRHVKGDKNLYVYASNAENDYSRGVITKAVLENSLSIKHENPLIFGCVKTSDGYYQDYCVGTIYWSKIWYTDLGEATCEELAMYPHEQFNLIVAGQRRFNLANVSNQRSSLTFVADEPLSNPLSVVQGAYSVVNHTQAWRDTDLNQYLNDKVYKGFPLQWRLLLKNCRVNSLEGQGKTSLVETTGYVIIPAAGDMGNADTNQTNLTGAPFVGEIVPANTCLPLFTDNPSRILYHPNGTPVLYWLRTPSPAGSSWQYHVKSDGTIYPYQSPYSYVINASNKEYAYVRIMVSI